jgi:hypothetical protein
MENLENKNIYAPQLAPLGQFFGVVGKAETGPPCFIGIGLRVANGDWKVQWYKFPVEEGFVSFEDQARGDELTVVGFTPLQFDWFGTKIKQELDSQVIPDWA